MSRIFRFNLGKQSLGRVVLAVVTRKSIQNLPRRLVVAFFRHGSGEIVLRGDRRIELQRGAKGRHGACHVTRQKEKFPCRELLLSIVGVEFGTRMVKLFGTLVM